MARPVTKVPQAAFPTTAPSGGYSMSRWMRVPSSKSCWMRGPGGRLGYFPPALGRADCAALRLGGAAVERPRPVEAPPEKLANGRPLPPSRGRTSAARTDAMGATITREVEPRGK
jgi:hypothetical protein